MKFQMKKWAIRAAIMGLQGLLITGRLIAVLGRFLAPGLRRAVRLLGRITLLPIYKGLLRVRRLARALISRRPAHLAGVFFYKFLPHTVLAVLLLAASATNLRAQTEPHEGVGQGSILFSLIAGDEEEFLSDETDIDFDVFEEEEGFAITKPTLPVGTRTAIAFHAVAPGDTLSSIAERYSIDVSSILWANKMGVRDFIRPGNRLTIPPVPGVLHTVKKGDTIGKIAKTYGADAAKILAFNQLSEDAALPVGEMLVVPGGRPPAAPVAPRRIAPLERIFIGGPKIPSAPGKFHWPTALSARFSQYFSWRHSGVDLALPVGNSIYAADDGIVTFSGWSRGYGYRVDVDHGNGIRTRYGHASKLHVGVGEQVSQGQVIAAIGSTGRSTGPHVHFEVIVSGRRVNPLKYIR